MKADEREALRQRLFKLTERFYDFCLYVGYFVGVVGIIVMFFALGYPWWLVIPVGIPIAIIGGIPIGIPLGGIPGTLLQAIFDLIIDLFLKKNVEQSRWWNIRRVAEIGFLM